jgi:hypothetical protein
VAGRDEVTAQFADAHLCEIGLLA